MSKIILLLILNLFISTFLFSQDFKRKAVLTDELKTTYFKGRKGDTVTIVNGQTEGNHTKYFIQVLNGYGGKEYAEADESDIKFLDTLPFWEEQYFIRSFDKKDLNGNYQFRKEVDIEDINLSNTLNDYKINLNDPFLEDYLNSLLYQIHPNSFIAGKPGSLNIKIINSPYPHALSFQSGGIYISTGLLSLCRSENELKSILTHEIAHVVMDHTLSNYVKKINDEERAKSNAQLAAVLSGIAAGAIGSAAGMDIGEVALLSIGSGAVVGAISYEASKSIFQNDLYRYQRGQEQEADEISTSYMTFYNNDSESFGKVLKRLLEYSYQNGNYEVINESSTHPNLIGRVEKYYDINSDYNSFDKNYICRISTAIINTSRAEFEDNHFEYAKELSELLIESGCATESAYLLLGNIKRTTAIKREDLLESLRLIEKAEQLNVENISGISLNKGLTQLRLGNNMAAIESFEKEIIGIEKEMAEMNRNSLEYNGHQRWINLLKREIYKAKTE